MTREEGMSEERKAQAEAKLNELFGEDWRERLWDSITTAREREPAAPRQKPEAPILELDQEWYGSDSAYPGIWITRLREKEGQAPRRTYIDLYPTGGSGDPDGSRAFRFGSDYYVEGMTYVDAADLEKRIECFQAAEILYLNAAEKGNVDAILSLGYVYSYNRCEGKFFQDFRRAETEEDYRRKVDHRQRAFECFSAAAEYDIPEAYYKLGDMYQKGMGCEESPESAFRCFVQAYKLCSPLDVYGRSGAALRLASCYERAYGCSHCFERALDLYEEAQQLFERIVSSGDWFYEKSLDAAKDGARRMRQELSFA